MTNEEDILKEISHKLDQLIILEKLSNLETINQYRDSLSRDKVYAKILKYSDESLGYSEMCDKISEELGVAKMTVMKKVSKLKDMGFLVTNRRGRKVYYARSGLFE